MPALLLLALPLSSALHAGPSLACAAGVRCLSRSPRLVLQADEAGTVERTITLHRTLGRLGISVSDDNVVLQLWSEAAESSLMLGDRLLQIDGVDLGRQRLAEVMQTVERKSSHTLKIERLVAEDATEVRNGRAAPGPPDAATLDELRRLRSQLEEANAAVSETRAELTAVKKAATAAREEEAAALSEEAAAREEAAAQARWSEVLKSELRAKSGGELQVELVDARAQLAVATAALDEQKAENARSTILLASTTEALERASVARDAAQATQATMREQLVSAKDTLLAAQAELDLMGVDLIAVRANLTANNVAFEGALSLLGETRQALAATEKEVAQITAVLQRRELQVYQWERRPLWWLVRYALARDLSALRRRAVAAWFRVGCWLRGVVANLRPRAVANAARGVRDEVASR